MSSLPSGTVSFLFTDMEGSTRLLQSLGDGYGQVLEQHRSLISGAAEDHRGHPMGHEGDGCFFAFARASEALWAALEAQRRISTHAWPDGSQVRVRMAVHTGEAVLSSDSYVGLAVHKVARICSAGNGGQILISAITKDLAGTSLPNSAGLKDLGEHRLKDLGQPEHLFQLTHPALESQFPPLRTLDVIPNNLPTQLNIFVGREKEIDEVKRLLSTARLVTVTGPGGSGKTRLALQVGAEVLDDFTEGAWLVDLAGTIEGNAIAETLGSVLGMRGIRPSQMSPAASQVAEDRLSTLGALVEQLENSRMLVVLDNCEHLISDVAEVSERLLRSCPYLRILATSREPLTVPGEARWKIPPLSLPLMSDGDLQESLRSEAIQLFVDRATLNQPDFELTYDNALAVSEICRKLDGMPLAIELAAAWTHALSPKQILERLDDRFKLLSSTIRRSQPRQQTLRATVDWSYELLSEHERQLLEHLSIFSGGFTLEAAERVCVIGDIEPDEVMHLLSQLVNKSLVLRETSEPDVRYRLLETIRQYGWERLAEALPPPRGKQSGDAAPNSFSGESREVIFRREGDYWAVGYPPDLFRLKHTKGLAYLGLLLSNPGQEHHCLTLAGISEGTSGTPLPSDGFGLGFGDAGEVIDSTAKSRYSDRLKEIEEEVAEALEFNDPERMARLEDERSQLLQQLSAGFGLRGPRRAGSAPEKARMSVGKAIRSAIAKIDSVNPDLGNYLRATVRTGVFCAFEPVFGTDIRWTL